MSVVGAEADILLSDDFDYADGALITVGSTTWAQHSGSISGEVQVLSGRALLTEADTEDVNAGFTPSGDTLYAGLTVRFTALPSSSGNYFCHFMHAGNTYRPKVFATTSGAATGQFRLGISNGGNSPDQILGVDLLLNTDYRLVFRYTISSPSGTLWVNPSSEADPSVTAADSATPAVIVAFALRQSPGIGDLEIDNLILGTSFSDVVADITPQAPILLTQPQTQSVIAGASVDFSVVASGEAPLSYHWSRNGTPLAGATDASLGLTNVTLADAGAYSVTVSNAVGMTNSLAATLSVIPATATFSVLDYNVKGNGVADWSTNSPQVRAIGRQVEYLDPDIITFQEIPYTNTWQMTNFVTAFRPGFHLADQSGTDGYIRSVILSRFPINRSQKWLDGVSLVPFGYNGYFTRDLFEAEIAVPGYPKPVHVFTTHLKAGQTTDASARRAAEANAISNYFVNGFLTTNASRPYLLTGDMNEDIYRPPSSNPQTIQRLTSGPTGL
ncbi:MAG: immunoglobulin domain-containing protein, partial [Verrucomicrobia bacterium]|nr:immunoglobulin domain-containing protein [Verrucomicrobiota bacterium]